MDPLKNKKLLGINSLGRIGKLMLWNQIHLRHFDGIVLNFGREVGKKLDDLIQIIENDSNYGNIHKFCTELWDAEQKSRFWMRMSRSSRLTACRSKSCAKHVTPKTSTGSMRA